MAYWATRFTFYRSLSSKSVALPHVHIALQVDLQPQTMEQIDEAISAEVPPDSDNPEEHQYHQLVIAHMLHSCCHSHACLDDSGKCKKHFPKPQVDCTYIDERGYVHYKRRTPTDQWVVPHNKTLLLMGDCHINVEV